MVTRDNSEKARGRRRATAQTFANAIIQDFSLSDSSSDDDPRLARASHAPFAPESSQDHTIAPPPKSPKGEAWGVRSSADSDSSLCSVDSSATSSPAAPRFWNRYAHPHIHVQVLHRIDGMSRCAPHRHRVSF